MPKWVEPALLTALLAGISAVLRKLPGQPGVGDPIKKFSSRVGSVPLILFQVRAGSRSKSDKIRGKWQEKENILSGH